MEYIHKDFNLAHVLKYGIAFHHGSLPLFIRKRIEDLYSKKKINFIFCTSTLLEGVNLPTKNVFIYPFPKKTVNDEKKCRLDFWNLAGRAGRYRSELTGNIVCL
ncbi:histidine kinase, partial [Escherichia coli]|nr:histidine kinase [Escherichia coli]